MTGYTLMEHCAVLVEDDRIADVFSERRFEQKRYPPGTEIIDVGGNFIVPGFIDTHIHGFGGFGTDNASGPEGTASVLQMSRHLVQYGVTAFNPTIYPSEPEEMLKAVSAVTNAVGREEGARIMGLHLEGPFLSPDKRGIMRPESLRSVDIPLMEKLWEAAEGRIVNMTVAPEMKGMRELALFCLKKGIVLQAGHTDAKYENMVEGMQVGILHATHLFNAMSRMDHRNPNAVGAVLIHPEMSCEIIADGFHVHPDLLKLLLRDKPVEKIVLITDALKPAGQESGPLLANGEEVDFVDGIFRRKTDGVIAGSALTMIRGVANLVKFGYSLEEAIKTASANPAQVMRYSRKGAIIPGYDADLAVIDSDFRILAVLCGGLIKKRVPPGSAGSRGDAAPAGGS
jgi:N-acetylglucosamine-6-phosphate deacetylase